MGLTVTNHSRTSLFTDCILIKYSQYKRVNKDLMANDREHLIINNCEKIDFPLD